MIEQALWVTHPHKFGPGRVHLLREDGVKTRCGVRLEKAPGTQKSGSLAEVTCQNCHGVLERERCRVRWRSRWSKREIDLVDLTAAELQDLADEFDGGEVGVFLENYAHFKKHFKNEDSHRIDDSGWDAGSLFCGRCGNRLSEDYALGTECRGYRSKADLIRQEYACWWDIYMVGKRYCDYCQHVSEKDN